MAGNSGGNPATHFGRQMRKERVARGWSVHEFAARAGISAGHISRIENGKRPPTEAVARACDAVFPERKGWFAEYYEDSKSWAPAGFRSWGEYEDMAVSLRAWSPGVLHGLLQTDGYARALLATSPGATDEMLGARLAARMERQRRVLMREDPPASWFIVDQLSLYREVGSGEVMAAQLRHLAEVAARPRVNVQVLPAIAHPANASELIVADEAAYVEHLIGGLVYTDEETVSSLLTLFNTIQVESFRASESLALIEEVAEIWATHGARAATATRTEDRA
jgi:hypothetical protein